MRDPQADSETGQNRKHVLGRHVYSYTREDSKDSNQSHINLVFARLKCPGLHKHWYALWRSLHRHVPDWAA